jgi:hypothetical protein
MRQKAILFALAAALLAACTKQDDGPALPIPIYGAGDTSKGWASMRKNGLEMDASAVALSCDGDSSRIAIYFLAYDTFGILSEYFVFGCFEVNTQKFELCSSSDSGCKYKANYWTTYDDQAEDLYSLSQRKPSFLEVTAVDSTEGWIEGRFDLHFSIDAERNKWMHGRAKSNPANPDHVRFSQGYFRVKLPD